MAASSKANEEQTVPRKSYTRNRKDVIIDNGSVRSPIWIEHNSKTISASMQVVPARKVPVLYYLSRNGQLEHPHLIDVTLSSPHGLYLKDVINTLNHHRGKGMANMYSWSFKRSYKNGYVWHDASDDDMIQPTNGNDYVIKGSELLQTQTPQIESDTRHTGDNYCGSALITTSVRRNQSWSSFDNPQDYVVLKCESNRELAAKFAPDTTIIQEQRSEENVTVDPSNDEIPSPPPSNSSSDVLDTVVSGSGFVDRREKVIIRDRDPAVDNDDQQRGSGRMKASQVFLQMISCGAGSVRV
uniref:protein SOSEKI 5-like n=1 Tax=Erigeron canadensis TaxID=72917 RepID=UPI001CB8FBCF|nr:protein SOSEKI 5-like [Erigeron canadensis]